MRGGEGGGVRGVVGEGEYCRWGLIDTPSVFGLVVIR